MLQLPQPNVSRDVNNTTRLDDVKIIFVMWSFMAPLLLDLEFYGHDSLLASLDCPQPGSDLLSSGFLSSLRSDTSKQVSISLGLSVPAQKTHHRFSHFKRGMDLLEWAQQMGTRTSPLVEEAEKVGTVQFGKANAQGILFIHINRYLLGQDEKE